MFEHAASERTIASATGPFLSSYGPGSSGGSREPSGIALEHARRKQIATGSNTNPGNGDKPLFVLNPMMPTAMPPSMSAMCTQARNVRSLAKKTCERREMDTRRVDGVSTLDQCLGVDLDGLHARLVRVAYGGLADGVVAAARAEHLFVALRCARRAACC